jgi:hypothetical protein
VSNSWAYVSSKLGNIKPETKQKAKEIFDAAAKAGHEIWFMWGMGSSTEHKTGRALDLMVRNEAAGDWVRNYIWVNRSRLRLQHVIWEQHITSTVTQPGVRRQMPDRGNSTKNHYDHNHVLFLTGAYVAPGKTTPPAPKPTPKPPAPKPPAPQPTRKTNDQITAEVIDGKWGNDPVRKAKLKAAGYNPNVIQALVNKALRTPGKKSIDTLVAEVIAGKWGNGDDRHARLTKAGYNYSTVQAAVNHRLG